MQSTCAFDDGFKVFLPALKGIVPLRLDLILNLALSSPEMATGLAVSKANDFSTAFIGTSTGRVLKVLLHRCTKIFGCNVAGDFLSPPIQSSYK